MNIEEFKKYTEKSADLAVSKIKSLENFQREYFDPYVWSRIKGHLLPLFECVYIIGHQNGEKEKIENLIREEEKGTRMARSRRTKNRTKKRVNVSSTSRTARRSKR